ASIVVIGDSLPKGRHILQSLLLDDKQKQRLGCKSRVIIELTNRFDYGIVEAELKDYYDLIRSLVENQPQNLGFVASNPFEIEFMRLRLNIAPEKYVLLKPLGVSPDDAVNPEDVKNSDDRIGFNPSIDRAIYNHFIEDNKQVAGYSGLPKHILRFKGYVEFPTHISSVEFHQRLAHGIPLVIPSPKLLVELIEAKHHRLFPYLEDLYRISTTTKRPWQEFVDYYDPAFAPFVYYFDTLDDLESIITKEAAKFDYKNTRARAPAFFRVEGGYRDKIVNGWKEVFLWPDLSLLPVYLKKEEAK
ncbi:UNVERIFIED_CONTAM: hypothetical protein HDU68_002194, partial [Siphonaria sp. JEL0065]